MALSMTGPQEGWQALLHLQALIGDILLDEEEMELLLLPHPGVWFL